MAIPPDELLRSIIAILEKLELRYFVTGSIAAISAVQQIRYKLLDAPATGSRSLSGPSSKPSGKSSSRRTVA